MDSRKFQAALVVLSFVFSSVIFSSSASAVVQSSEHLEVKLKPGEWKVVKWTLFSDKEITTQLKLSKDGQGSDLISVPATVSLPGRGSAYVLINASLPKTATSASGQQIVVLPSIRAIETAQIASSENSVILGEASTDVSLVLNGTDTSQTTSESATSESSGDDSTSPSSDGETDGDGDDSDATSGSSQSGGQNASSATTSAAGPSGNASSSGAAANNETATIAADDDREEDDDVRVVVVEGGGERDGDADSFVRDVRKSAREIRELRKESRTNKAGSSDKHDFDFGEGGVAKIEIEFSGNVAGVRTVVNTLAVSKVSRVEDVYLGTIDRVVNETSDDGVVNTPFEVVPPESVPAGETDVTIDVGSTELPDIESRVMEEVRPDESGGSVVRTITKKKAYKYLEIEIEGAQASDVEKALINFDVARSWLDDNGIGTSDVRLNRYVDGNWIELPTRLVGEDASGYHFVAESPGFSFFVITAAITADITTPIKIEVPQQAVSEAGQKDDFVGDLFGTTQPQSLVTINISWLLAVVVLGMVVLFKFNDIKRAMGFMHAGQERARELAEQKTKYEKMKEETTKRFYKRMISEDEFKNLVMEYDRQLISIETEMAQMKDGKKPAAK